MFGRAKEKENQSSRASLELLYNISRELAAALDLRTVLQRVLFLSMKYVGAISGSVIVLDASGQPVESAIITGAQVHDHTTQQLRITFERGLAGWVIRQQQAVLIPDTSRDERWVRRPDDAEDRTGAKSAVSAPILAREELVGVITMVHSRPGFFTQDHLALVQSIADQAGMSILNARLYNESQRHAGVMSALANSSAMISSSVKLDEVLQRILEQTMQGLRVEVVSLALLDPSDKELVYRATTNNYGGNIVGYRLPVGVGIAGWVAREGAGVIVPDVAVDERFYAEIDRQAGFRTRAVACAPIRQHGRVIGVLQALNPLDGQFDTDALSVLTGIGSLAGTAIRHAQLFESLQQAHRHYLELFQDSIDPIILTDWQGNIHEANRQVTGLTNLDIISLRQMNIRDLQVVDAFSLGEDFCEVTKGDTITYERSLFANGQSVPVQVYVRKVLFEDDLYLQWILRDITERKNFDDLRNDLLSMIYHDLRSPLANVVSSLDVLESMLPLDEDPALRSLLSIAIRSSERISRLTNSLLDIRRLETGQPIVNQQLASPTELILDALEAVRMIAEGKNQQLVSEIQTDLPNLWVDADMIRRVLINLVENAVKYTPSGSQIHVGAHQSSESHLVELWVRDNGPGIPAVDRERIFDKYARLQSKDGPKGFGLGLAFCRLAVEKHGGRIWVDSENQVGSTFHFLLPVALENHKERLADPG
jgi:PAS domain S-box-containing protein